MKVNELIESRQKDWDELERLTARLGRFSIKRRKPEEVARFSALYREATSDLAHAKSYQFPPAVTERLNSLVGAAYLKLYRSNGLNVDSVWRLVFYDAPRWIITDPFFWIAMTLFWGGFVGSFVLALYVDPTLPQRVLGEETVQGIERMYSVDVDFGFGSRLVAYGGYIFHNGSIGLKCFATSILACIPGIYTLLYNAIALGLVFGHMYSQSVGVDVTMRFNEFTTAHSAFELTAIVLSATAGLRMGFSLVYTRGFRRLDSLRRGTYRAAPTIILAFVLFCFAAFIEGFLSPGDLNSSIGSWNVDSLTYKRVIMWASIVVLFVYLFVLGLVQIAPSSRRRKGEESGE